MCIMRVPGFTAENSLYQTSERYQMFRTLGQSVNTLDSAIVGQFGTCEGNCLSSCSSSFDFGSCRQQCRLCLSNGEANVIRTVVKLAFNNVALELHRTSFPNSLIDCCVDSFDF